MLSNFPLQGNAVRTLRVRVGSGREAYRLHSHAKRGNEISEIKLKIEK